MERTIVGFLLLIGLLILSPPNFCFAQQTTMCISQFALANQACAVLPSELALRGRNSSRSKADDSDSGTRDDNDNDDDDDDDDDENDDGVDNSNDDSDDNDDGDDESERRRKRRRKHDRGNKKKGRKYEKHGGKRGRSGHGHEHGGGHEVDEPRANKDCCRWLEELDESCVCAALLHLPPFLVKPNHKYSIKVGKSCKFSYRCYGI